ncbi:hypothetical protein TSUD_116090 [Trifolium subterraneum]|uniref:Membrane-associated kinase regulator 1 n=1 Tax=Trifolium subterraneum TaxID=3900 RepID=A0A2Z6MN20_TRISU|nr:hypothetical protein TSUD_116090 [Trifolium subterraneum]
MGKRRTRVKESKSYTLPSSPSHSFSSSSSSDFEFTISISPRKSSNNLCPADELFYKGQLLPLHLSPRISMVRTLLLSSSSTSSATSSSTAPRDSTGSSASNDSTTSFISDLALFPDSCDSSRPSSVTEDDELKRLHHINNSSSNNNNNRSNSQLKKPNKYFSLSRFSSVFRKETVAKTREVAETVANSTTTNNSSVKRMSVTAKEVIRKYFKKVKPLYEKLSQKQQQQTVEDATNTTTLTTTTTVMSLLQKTERSEKESKKENVGMLSHSFSGNLRYPRKRTCVSSCPSSMRSSPSHSGVLSQKGVLRAAAYGDRDASSMEELQSAIQGAITHCKNSLIPNN